MASAVRTDPGDMTLTSRIATLMSLLTLGALGASEAHAAAGELDRSFGTRGKVVRDMGGIDYVADLTTQADRDVLALVGLQRGRDEAVGVMRLQADGRLDRRFGRRGIAVVNLAGDEYPGGIARAARGRIVVSFTSSPSAADGAFGVARFRRDGTPDPTLDRDGVQTAGFGTGFSAARANDVAMAGSDIVAAGQVFAPGGTGSDFAIVRFNPNGALDTAFSGDGRQTTDFNEEHDAAYGLAVDSQGRVVAVGAADQFLAIDPLALARYDAAGELDGSFSDDGRLVSTIAPAGADVATLPDDRIAIAGTVSGDFLAARFLADGAPDVTFSGDGVQTVDFMDGTDSAVALAAAGAKLVLAGTIRTGRRGRDFGIARLGRGGWLDPTFSQDGRRAVDFARAEDNGLAVAIDPTGDIVAAGRAERHGEYDAAAVRLHGRDRR